MTDADVPAPAEGLLVTMFLTVANVPRSVAFYRDVLGGKVVRERDPAVIRLGNAWVLLNPGGGPTPDKPGMTLAPPNDPSRATSFLNLRVADIEATHRQFSARGAEFLTPPIPKRGEVRCYLRDPDGYLIELGQATAA
jgi:catechol 2,3-dioxygenase-like lactoylglutathione lyase family enzyme